MLATGHINEINNDKSTQVTQTQLAGYFVGGFHVGVIGSLFNIRALGCAGRVDIDGEQGFGVIEHNCAARW